MTEFQAGIGFPVADFPKRCKLSLSHGEPHLPLTALHFLTHAPN
jgi:hypothetical protein